MEMKKMIIDLHQDIGTASGDPNFRTYGQTSLEQLRKVGISICGVTDYWRVPEDEQPPKDEDTIKYYKERMKKEEKFILSKQGIPDSPEDSLNLILIQEGFAVPEPDNLTKTNTKINALFKAGIRILQPVYQGYQKHKERTGTPSPIGTSSFDVPGAGEKEGLTDLGKRVCYNWLEKGGIIDGAHASPATLKELIDICKQRKKPLLISHTGSRSLVDHPRCLSDNQLEYLSSELKEIGFLIGLGISVLFLNKSKKDSSLFQWVNIAQYVGEKVGWDHIAIGSDLGGALSGLPGKYKNCEEIFPSLLTLLKENFSSTMYQKITFKNALNFFKETLP